MSRKINWAEVIDMALMPAPRKRRIREPNAKETAKLKKWTEAKSGRLIRKAADIMSDKGHANGRLQDTDGSFCIRGAVNYAWCGNANITGNYEYFNLIDVDYTINHRNPEVIRALSDFRAFLFRNGLLEEDKSGVEWFNDKNDSSEVIRWMYKYADEVDPKR